MLKEILFVLCAIVATTHATHTCGGVSRLNPWDYEGRSEMASRIGSLGQLPTFQQLVDHSGAVEGTFQQRYIMNDTFYQPGGPVFLYLAGEGPIEGFLVEVEMFEWCRKQGALFIMLEHRYYGLSSPVPSYSTENMKLLSSEQALEDAAYFIKHFPIPNKTSETKWMIFGCSYSGMLSGWFRMLYPDLVVGAYAPSGPVLAQANYTGYAAQYADTVGVKCAKATQEAAAAVFEASKTAKGLNQLADAFQSCQKPIAQEDVYYFLWTVGIGLAGVAQEDLPPRWPAKAVCAVMEGSGDPITRYAKALDAMNLGPRVGNCNDFTEASFIKSMQNFTVEGSYDGSRSWWWQKCTEFGYFKGSYPGTSVFFPNLNFEHVQGYCEQIFDQPGLKPDCDATNRKYGGLHMAATNVVITQGLLDPWHRLGICKSYGGVKAFMYEAGHCAPLHQPTKADPLSLKLSRDFVYGHIVEYLKEKKEE